MKDQSFLTFGNLFDAGMEENIFGSGCEPVGDALLRLMEVWQPLQVSSRDLGGQEGLESQEEVKLLLSLVFLLFCDLFGGQSEVRLKDLPSLEKRHPLLSWEPVLNCLADQSLEPRVRGYFRFNLEIGSKFWLHNRRESRQGEVHGETPVI